MIQTYLCTQYVKLNIISSVDRKPSLIYRSRCLIAASITKSRCELWR